MFIISGLLSILLGLFSDLGCVQREIFLNYTQYSLQGLIAGFENLNTIIYLQH